MNRTNKITGKMNIILAGFFALTFALASSPKATAAGAALNSAGGAIQLTAVVPAQLKLSLSTVTLDIKVDDPSQSSEIVTVPVTSSWALDSSTSNVELVGYFDSPVNALADNAGHSIPANHVLGGLASDTLAPFVETNRVGTANSSRTFFRQEISHLNATNTRIDTLQIQLNRIDDLGAPAAEYRGVLHLRLVSY